MKALVGKEGKGGEDTLIVFHNLNKASSALMESLCSIFNKKQTNILRPDGKTESKAKINLIGIINSQSNIAIKDKLPISLINSVFYYILPKLSPNEIEKIILKTFKANDLIEEAHDFAKCFSVHIKRVCASYLSKSLPPRSTAMRLSSTTMSAFTIRAS